MKKKRVDVFFVVVLSPKETDKLRKLQVIITAVGTAVNLIVLIVKLFPTFF